MPSHGAHGTGGGDARKWSAPTRSGPSIHTHTFQAGPVRLYGFRVYSVRFRGINTRPHVVRFFVLTLVCLVLLLVQVTQLRTDILLFTYTPKPSRSEAPRRPCAPNRDLHRTWASSASVRAVASSWSATLPQLADAPTFSKSAFRARAASPHSGESGFQSPRPLPAPARRANPATRSRQSEHRTEIQTPKSGVDESRKKT